MTHRAAVAAGLLLLASAGTVRAEQHNVSITGSAFSPPTVNIKMGDTVVWTNDDLIQHTVTADDASFDSGTIDPAGTFSRTFTTTGSAPYHCNFHFGMAGTVVVAPLPEVTHGTDQVYDLATQSLANAYDGYTLGQEAYSSYEVQVDVIEGDFAPFVLERLDSAGTAVQTGVALTALDKSRVLRWLSAAGAATSSETLVVRSATCGSFCVSVDRYRLRVFDTTYAIPRFNNSSSQITVLLLQNRSSQAVGGLVHFWNGAGTLLASLVFNVAADGALVVNTSTLSLVAGQAGTITVVSDAPAGQLAGKAVAVEPATGFTFDTQMVPRLP